VSSVRGREPDVCIVGAGIAAALLAERLGAAGARVLVLEAGPRHSPERLVPAMHDALAGRDPWSSDDPQRDLYTTAGSTIR
jgi:choline dehydrogenase-like flavoprotein